MARVAGKVALITGGASGLGEATARLLAAEGAAVVLTDIQDEKGEAVAAEIRAAGAGARYRHQDVTDESLWQEVVDEIVAREGGLDILVNAAGVSSAGLALSETSLEDWRRITAINLDGTFLGVKHGVRAMAERGGSIVNISSILGLIGLPKASAYAASKGGVRLLTKAAAIECKGFGYKVRVNSVHPGFIDTPMVQSRLQSPDGGRVAKLIEQVQGPLGEARDIAQGILYLASDDAKFVTGTELVIDFGMTAQ
ncbi:MAG: SDR family oxidoreductase [Alphaproteobacteria bacterium]|jgi:NAD(P)-dependent dehydrogenase (short-subunit alcohol dehydrogenase family)|nr:SDR family oxidoreductase [Alphaproteobacteria bacterium]